MTRRANVRWMSACLVAGVLLSATHPAAAESVVIDFEPLVHAAESIYLPDYAEEGFEFASTVDPVLAGTALSVWGTSSENFNGSTALFSTYQEAFTVLTRTDHQPFSLLSIDLGPAFAGGGSGGTVRFMGRTTSDEVVTRELQFSPGLAPMTFLFAADPVGGSFTDLTEVRWEQDAVIPHQFDNLRVQVIPEPASVLLLAVGLVLVPLGAFMRRQSC